MHKFIIAGFIFFIILAIWFFFKETSSEKEKISQNLKKLIKDDETIEMKNLLASVDRFSFSLVYGTNFKVTVYLAKDYFLVLPKKNLFSFNSHLPLVMAKDPVRVFEKLRIGRIYQPQKVNLSSTDAIYISFKPKDRPGNYRLNLKFLNPEQKKKISVAEKWELKSH